MKALITGINGFVGEYLRQELINSHYEVLGVDRAGRGEAYTVDLLDAVATHALIEGVRADIVFHLAGQASVSLSWKDPANTIISNICPTINLINAVKRHSPRARLVLIGSADQYGVVAPDECPIGEKRRPVPVTPYAVSKQAQEDLALSMARQLNLDIVLTRSFNHTGAGQYTGFVVSDFAGKISRVFNSGELQIAVGNLNAVRDFSDVRDIVRAYRLLGEKGETHEVYNVGSGKGVSVREILNQMLKISGAKAEIVVDPLMMRPLDTPVLICDNSKLIAHTGYESQIPLETTLHSVLEYYNAIKG